MKNSLKTITTMLAIILVCGALLAILSDLLHVSDQERIDRAIGKIYIEQVNLKETIDVNSIDLSSEADKGEIKACYLLDNGDYLVLSKGKKGYANGTVTTYVAISSNLVVKKVVQDSYTGQTLMSKLTDIYSRYIDKNASTTYDEFGKIVVSGATFSSNATSNSVYVALRFVNAYTMQGGQN